MRLSLHSDYALRLLMLLAVEPHDVHTIESISRRYDISRNHLMKIAQTLARAGFIDSVRGRGGGLALRRPAQDINVGAVVRATEDSFAVVECFDRDRNSCRISPACGLRGVLHEALDAFLAVLDGHTLASLVKGPSVARRLRQLLSAEPAAGAAR